MYAACAVIDKVLNETLEIASFKLVRFGVVSVDDLLLLPEIVVGGSFSSLGEVRHFSVSVVQNGDGSVRQKNHLGQGLTFSELPASCHEAFGRLFDVIGIFESPLVTNQAVKFFGTTLTRETKALNVFSREDVFGLSVKNMIESYGTRKYLCQNINAPSLLPLPRKL